jgi:hypothetical protein
MLGCSISHSHRQSKNVVFLTPRLPCFILCRLTFPSSDETGCNGNLEVSESTLYSFECFCICTVLYYVIYFHTYECAVYTVCTVRVWSTATAKLHLVHVVFVFNILPFIINLARWLRFTLLQDSTTEMILFGCARACVTRHAFTRIYTET